jgi:hypothetical protein
MIRMATNKYKMLGFEFSYSQPFVDSYLFAD